MTAAIVREWREEDLGSLLECARSVFGAGREKSRAEWAWAFARPGLPRRGFVAVEGERVVGAYLGQSQRLRLMGEERRCAQVVDLMVHPDARGGLGRRSLHRELGRAFIGTYGERGEDALHYGWPVAAARRSGHRQLGYELLREESCLLRGVDAPSGALPAGVEALEALGPAVDRLAARCATAPAQVPRDAAWLRWRFLERPACEYRLLGVPEGDELLGIAALRTTPWDWGGALPICEWLVPPAESAVAEALERAVAEEAAARGARELVALLPDSTEGFGAFQGRGWRVRPTPYVSVVRAHAAGVDADWLRRHWDYSLADSDLA